MNSLPGNQKPMLVTASSGNHAQALALTAKKIGLDAYIAMPSNAPQVKKDAVRGYGATIIDCGPNTYEVFKTKIVNLTRRLKVELCIYVTGQANLISG